MTTKDSPPERLQAQADRIAHTLKYLEKNRPVGTKTGIKYGVAMDDKVITVEMTWVQIQQRGTEALAAHIYKLMREEPLQ